VAPGGFALVSCRSRNPGEDLTAFPLALDRAEIDGFQRAGLMETTFESYDDDSSASTSQQIQRLIGTIRGRGANQEPAKNTLIKTPDICYALC